MDKDNSFGSALARNALDCIPGANADAKDIVGLVKSDGRVNGYQPSDGNENNNLSNLPSISV